MVTASQDLNLHHVVLQLLLAGGVDHLGGRQRPRHLVLCLGGGEEVSWGMKGTAPQFSARGKLGPIASLPRCSVPWGSHCHRSQEGEGCGHQGDGHPERGGCNAAPAGMAKLSNPPPEDLLVVPQRTPTPGAMPRRSATPKKPERGEGMGLAGGKPSRNRGHRCRVPPAPEGGCCCRGV